MAQISFLTSGIFTKFYEELKLIKFQLSIVICNMYLAGNKIIKTRFNFETINFIYNNQLVTKVFARLIQFIKMSSEEGQVTKL